MAPLGTVAPPPYPEGGGKEGPDCDQHQGTEGSPLRWSLYQKELISDLMRKNKKFRGKRLGQL
jgi:hypothetical protein